jgi:hypothetical protein
MCDLRRSASVCGRDGRSVGRGALCGLVRRLDRTPELLELGPQLAVLALEQHHATAFGHEILGHLP